MNNKKTRTKITVQQAYNNETAKQLKTIQQADKRAFQAAEFNNTVSKWFGSRLHVNKEIQYALTGLRARSRELEQNSPLVQTFFGLLESNIIGPEGFVFKAQSVDYKQNPDGSYSEIPDVNANALIEKHWTKWCYRGVCDVTGKHSFKEVQKILVRTVARDGEALVIKHRTAPTKKNPYGFALEIIDTNRLDLNKNAAPDKNGICIIMGVEQDSFGRPIAYHFIDTYSGREVKYRRVVADDVYHVYMHIYPEQTRGVPWLHSVMLPLHQLDSFINYTLVAARIGAATSGFFQKTGQTIGGADQIGDYEDEFGNVFMEAEPGQFQQIPEGWEFKEFKPAFPDQVFEGYVKAIQRNIAAGVQFCYNILFNDLENVNYSSIRQALLAQQDRYKSLHTWFNESFNELVFEDWFDQAMLLGALRFTPDSKPLPIEKADKFRTAYKFQGRSWQWVDPRNDLEAAKLAIEMGVLSPRRVAEQMGEDLDANMRETALIKAKAQELNISMAGVYDPTAEASAQAAAAQVQATDQAAARAAADNIQLVETVRSQVQAVAQKVEAVRDVAMQREPAAAPTVTVTSPAVTVEAPQVHVTVGGAKKVVKTKFIEDERGMYTAAESTIEEVAEESVEETQEQPETPVDQATEPVVDQAEQQVADETTEAAEEPTVEAKGEYVAEDEGQAEPEAAPAAEEQPAGAPQEQEEGAVNE